MWLYLSAAVVGLSYVYIWNLWQYWKRQGIKGPPPSFMGRGNSKELSKTTIKDALDKWSKEYGDVFGIYFLWLKPVLIVNDPEMVKGKRQSIIIFIISTRREKWSIGNRV